MRPAPLSQTCCDQAALWLWPGHALYVGPALGVGFHSGGVSCLAVGVEGDFTIEVEHGSRHRSRTALVAARVRHRIVAGDTPMAFCYLDPASQRERACRRLMDGGAELALGHEWQAELVRTAASLTGHTSLTEVPRWLDLTAPDGLDGNRDPRILMATTWLEGPLGRRVAAQDLAAEAGLSVSAFLRLFRAETGTTFRRYRLWARMLRVAELLQTWPDLSTAAVEAGFASPSHFSSAFHAMFGLRPSTLFSRHTTINTIGRPAEETTRSAV
ncbi:helix-turn-helix domain-containing protein [Streptomyces sp. NPDC093097]|uniref:helix-turn-helix domain-containing protein n=1 Tax=Streptomyces sp. NPDC093097 TaxID=3366027 RepID=UPI0038180966